ncbi:MAG: 4Fe-4S binding protein [Pseudomonadota bacterium]
MAHHLQRSGYALLVERLNRAPQGAPPSALLDRILELLLDEREAALLSRLPIRPFTVTEAARRWRLPVAEARALLDELASRALLLDLFEDEERRYVLPPPMAGFFEFSLMRVRADLDQRALSELFHQYLNVEEDFVRELFTVGETRLGRVFVSEPALSEANALHVLDFERASHVARTAATIGLGLCYCRHKASHLGRACAAPLEICLTFNNAAASLVHHGHARSIEVAQALDLLAQARARGLVQFGENVREGVNFICNCCGCCCEALLAHRRFTLLQSIHTSPFLPVVAPASCTGCGACARACPVEAITVQAGGGAVVDVGRCLGCGVCVMACARGALTLEARPARVLTPADGVERAVLMAIERGKLQHLIFDDPARWSHRALAAVLGVLMRLPAAKWTMAQAQLHSRYLERALTWRP